MKTCNDFFIEQFVGFPIRHIIWTKILFVLLPYLPLNLHLDVILHCILYILMSICYYRLLSATIGYYRLLSAAIGKIARALRRAQNLKTSST